MEIPSTQTVLGNFNDTEFRYFGRITRFTKAGDSFQVTTENQQGQQETFKVAYTLGYKPLQQYLVETGGGRLQALPFAWDTREKKDGGQRWFHLYPKDNVTPANPLFWTRPMQNWNHMCGDCHTTGFSKNFSAGVNAFESRWSETGNGCESCHGSGSTHVEAKKVARDIAVKDSSISVPRTPKSQIDQCGACHARRVRLREASSREHMLDTMLETWRPQLPQDGLYFVDGQIREEVFEIGSFLQSKMAAKGVRCTDCHDPHTARLKAEGNALCTQCHKVETFDRVEHYFHKPGTAGAQCVSCHMPARTYMVVHLRRDHRLAIPRPDLSNSLSTPNPCTSCHTDRPNSWAAEEVRKQTSKMKGSGNAVAETWGMVAWQASQEQLSATEILNGLLTKPSFASANPIAKAAVLASNKGTASEIGGCPLIYSLFF
jgi:predicted CXXCH cytochrome family protein